ncbi:MAG TPA: RDD family protein [Thermoanaerobaculia bacterium]|nr:RDD family protein [Thermoanaerobaculia bacterium]
MLFDLPMSPDGSMEEPDEPPMRPQRSEPRRPATPEPDRSHETTRTVRPGPVPVAAAPTAAGAPREEPADREGLASFGRRAAAGVADLVVHAAVVMLALLGCRALDVQPGFPQAVPAFALLLLSFSFLYTVLPLAFWGHTPGMAWAAITSRNRDGEPLTFDQTVRRWLGGLLTLALLGLPLLAALGGRTLTDWISGSATYPFDDEDEPE